MVRDKRIKKKYKPTPFHNKDKYGKHIPHKQRAQHAAKYFSETQWGRDTQETPQLNETPIVTQEGQGYSINPPNIEEIRAAIKKIKKKESTRTRRDTNRTTKRDDRGKYK